MIVAPLLDLPRRPFVRRIRLNPFQDLAVPFAGGQLLQKSVGIETEKTA